MINHLASKFYYSQVSQFDLGLRALTKIVILFTSLFLAACSSVNFSLDVPQETDEPEFQQQRASYSFSNQLNDYALATTTADIEQGEILFKRMCMQCHVPQTSTGMKKLFSDRVGRTNKTGEAPDFKSKNYEPNYAEEYLYLRIQYGKNNDGKDQEVTVHSMPSWEGSLNPEQINNLVAYIMSLAK